MHDLLIDHVPLFAALPALERAALESELRLIDYPAGMVLWHEGEHGERRPPNGDESNDY